MRTGQPGQGPGPRHDPVRVVTAAPRRQPAAPGVPVGEGVDEARRRAVRGRGHVQVSERVPGMRIGAVLRHDEIGRERGGQFGEQQLDGREPRPLTGPGRHRDVDARAGGHALPHLVHVAGPREQRPTSLVEGDREHARIVPVDRLHAVAVMHIEVDVQHPQPIPPGPGDREGRVVVDAEPGRPLRHRVMQPATRMLGVLHVPAQDRLDGPQRASGDRRRRLVHAGEWRAVATLADAGLREPERVDREALDHVQVPRRVAPQQLLVRRRLRRQPWFRPDSAQQIDARPEPPRRQRMTRPEVEVEERGPNTRSIASHDTRRTAARRATLDPASTIRACRISPSSSIVILVLVLLWRGPKTLPKLGEALGRGVREAKSEAGKAQAEIQARAAGEPVPPDEPAKPDGPV